jgi:hypothetical protein
LDPEEGVLASSKLAHRPREKPLVRVVEKLTRWQAGRRVSGVTDVIDGGQYR